jgi:chorismate mutase
VAARRLGFDRVPLLCAREIDVPGSLPRVIRVLIHHYAGQGHAARHVYLGEARALRADLEAAQ